LPRRVLGATNRPDIIDEALLRPRRFDRILEVPQPNKEGRIEILKIHTKKKPLAKDVDLAKLAEMTEGFTGADLAAVANGAAMASIKEYVRKTGKDADQDSANIIIAMGDFEAAIRKIKGTKEKI
jgi:transitional endoplasmic reticulum ATPase